MMQVETWRYHANRWQTWVGIAVVTLWIIAYIMSTANKPLVPSSSGYWPNTASGYDIPFQGGIWSAPNPNATVDVPRDQMVLLGQHNGVTYYGRPGDRVGGGGGYGGPLWPRIYVQAGDGKFIPLERTQPDPNAGQWMR